jgi:hypothetical protein
MAWPWTFGPGSCSDSDAVSDRHLPDVPSTLLSGAADPKARSSSDLWHRTNESKNNLPDALPSRFLPCAMAPTMLILGASRGAAQKAAVPSPCSTSGISGPFPRQLRGVRTNRSLVEKQRSFQTFSMSGNGVTVAASQRMGPILGHYPLL